MSTKFFCQFNVIEKKTNDRLFDLLIRASENVYENVELNIENDRKNFLKKYKI